MNKEFDNLLSAVKKFRNPAKAELQGSDFSSIFFNKKELNNRANNQHRYNRDYWIKPEYDLNEIAIAMDVESYFRQSIQKKTNKIISAGFNFVSQNDKALRWIDKRIQEISIATNKPWNIFVAEVFVDMFRWYNCMILKVRHEDFGSGEGLQIGRRKVQPVAGYFILRLDKCEFQIKKNGTLKSIKQRGEVKADDKIWSAKDIIHIYAQKKPGFLLGTPEAITVLDDMRILRRIEENVIDLIETNLFPVFHYTIGSDKMPERMTEGGVTESKKVSNTIKYMASTGFIVSDHRHKITALGSESKALRIDYYLTHFKERVLAGLAMSPVDLGMGDTANRSTASSMSKSMLSDIEAMSLIVKQFIEMFIICELLEEGGFNSLDPLNKVEIRFGVIDKEEKRADENQVIQTFTNNIVTLDEARKQLQLEPYTDEHLKRSHMNMFQIPLIEAEGAIKQDIAEKSAAQKQSTSRARPSNQHGTRSAPKTRRDIEILNQVITITCDSNITSDTLKTWQDYVIEMYQIYDGTFSLQSIADTTSWRLNAHSSDPN